MADSTVPPAGADRSRYVAEAARRAFVLDPQPNLLALSELLFEPLPSSLWVNGNDVSESAPAELHAIGVYEARRTEDDVVDKEPLELRPVRIHVRKADNPVMLFLMSYDPVRWEIEVAPDASLAAVSLSSHRPSAIRCSSQLHAVLPVMNGPHVHRLGPSEDGEGIAAEQLVEQIHGATGLPLASFQGTYYGEAFTVPPCSDGTLIREIIKEHERGLRLHTSRPPAAFHLIHEGAVVLYGSREEPIALPEPRIKALTFCEADRRFYGITDHELIAFDASGAAEKIVPVDVERLSWLGGITYDAKRRRILLSTHWHTGVHHILDPVERTWKVVPIEQTLGGLHALAYAAERDVVYAIGGPGLVCLTPDLEPIGALKAYQEFGLPGMLLPTTALQMGAVEDAIVVCGVAPGGDRHALLEANQSPPIGRGWVFDRLSGRVSLLDLAHIRPRRESHADPPSPSSIEMRDDASGHDRPFAANGSGDYEGFVTLHDLRHHAAEIVRQVARTGKPLLLNARPGIAMLVPYEVHHGLLATLDEMSFADWQERLARAQREIEQREQGTLKGPALHRISTEGVLLTPQGAAGLDALSEDGSHHFLCRFMDVRLAAGVPLDGPFAGWSASFVPNDIRIVSRRVGSELWVGYVRRGARHHG